MLTKNMPHRKQARRLAALKRFKMKPSRKGVQSLEDRKLELDRLTILAHGGTPKL